MPSQDTNVYILQYNVRRSRFSQISAVLVPRAWRYPLRYSLRGPTVTAQCSCWRCQSPFTVIILILRNSYATYYPLHIAHTPPQGREESPALSTPTAVWPWHVLMWQSKWQRCVTIWSSGQKSRWRNDDVRRPVNPRRRAHVVILLVFVSATIITSLLRHTDRSERSMREWSA